MLSKISSTFAHKMLIMLANFFVVVLVSKQLGSEGRGEMSLFMSDFVLVLLFTGIMAGSAMSYFVPKKDVFTIGFVAYCWSVIVALLGVFVLHLFHPSAYTWWLLGAGLIQSFNTVHQMILVGKNRLLAYNVNTAIQPVLTLVYVVFYFQVLGQRSIGVFVEGFFYSSLVSYVVAVFQSRSFLGFTKSEAMLSAAQEMLRFGSGTYFSTIVQTINYRLSYYVLFWLGMSKAVGEMSNGVALAEATWMISNSLSLVLYAHILNSHDEKEQAMLTLRFSKLCFLLTSASLLVLWLVPSEVYVYVFGKDFTELKNYILILSPGVLLLGVSTVMAHYFSAKGYYKENNIKSLIGLFSILPAMFLFIPWWGKNGAAIASSFSYAMSSGYLFYHYFKITKTPLADLAKWGDLPEIWRRGK